MKKLLPILLLLYSLSSIGQNAAQDSTYPCLHTANSFDGTQFLKISSVGAYLNGVPFTVEAWVKTYGTTVRPIIASEYGNGWAVGLNANSELSLSKNGTGEVLSTASVPSNTWHHIAVAVTSSNTKFYLDGNLITTAGFPGPFIDGNNGAYVIGGGSTQGNYFFTGEIDELRVWAGERSASQITALKDTELVGNNLQGLRLYYQFNESSGASIALDEVNPPHNATMQNGGSINSVASVPLTCTIDVGIFENDLYNLVVSPNPANEILNIDIQDFQQMIADKPEIIICDLQGRQVYKTKLMQQRLTIDVSGFANGLYLLSLQSSKGATIKRIEIVK